jgi:hypothetical protein
MKDTNRDFSTEKQFRLIKLNRKTGWSDFSDTNNPTKRIEKFKTNVKKYNATGVVPNTRMAGCGNLEDLEFIVTEIKAWSVIS